MADLRLGFPRTVVDGLHATTRTVSFGGSPVSFGAAPVSFGLDQYLEHGTAFVPAPAVQTASMTGAAAGGAPGALFGPPGVGGAPVIPGGPVSPIVLGLGLLVAGLVIWKVLS